MDINFVERDKIENAKKRSSKFKPLLEALSKLEVGGDAIEVPYEDDKNVNSMRTAVYQYNQDEDVKIKSGKDSDRKKIYFYREK
jgi:UDP:flavonoid glycosyltransferase YjiC (YdhE family)